MTDKELRLYLVYKRKQFDLERRISNLKAEGVVTCDKVKSSMSVHPYIETTVAVHGSDDYELDRLRAEKNELLRAWSNEVKKAAKKINEIEKFIQGLPEDNDIQNMFRWTYYDGMTQEQIAQKLFLDRSTVSKRMSQYLDK